MFIGAGSGTTFPEHARLGRAQQRQTEPGDPERHHRSPEGRRQRLLPRGWSPVRPSKFCLNRRIIVGCKVKPVHLNTHAGFASLRPRSANHNQLTSMKDLEVKGAVCALIQVGKCQVL